MFSQGKLFSFDHLRFFSGVLAATTNVDPIGPLLPYNINIMGTPIDDNVLEGMQQEEDEDSVFIFGRDISKIPCFRNSFLTGMYGGIGCGIATFLATSRPGPSTHVSVASFTIITLGYWFNCRYHWAKNYFNMKQSEDSFPEEIEAIKARKIAKEDSIRKISGPPRTAD